ncbi:MAG: FtsQ-type POTRA domain-containing protein [Anaerolineaceae bacterium]
MSKLFSKDSPDKRAESLRQRRSQTTRVPSRPTPLPQVMPPLQVTTLEADRRSDDLSDGLFKKSSRSAGTSRPSMMTLVYPPLKEADLKATKKTDGTHQTDKPSAIRMFKQLIGRDTRAANSMTSKKPAAHHPSVTTPHSVYINPRLLVHEPVKRKVSIKGLNLGWRLLSLALAGALSYAIYFMWTSPLFKMVTPTVTGNVRVESADFIKIMAVEGKPAFAIVPVDIRNTLLNTFPELVSVDLTFHFPNTVSLKVNEREPVLIWKQGGQTVWLDIFGIPMQPRGQAGNWYVVTAEGSAIGATPIDPVNKPGLYKPVADPGLILTVLTLGNLTPAGTSIAYDPLYGLGWNDPQGWKVYFGFNTDGFDSKLAQYAGIVANLGNQGIHPRIISVQYPYAPFYRLE